MKRSPIKRKPKSDKEWRRQYHSLERVYFVSRALPCVACDEWGTNHNHHWIGGGMGHKADYTAIIPLCPRHHLEIHTVGKATFARHYDLDLERCASQTQQKWESHGADLVDTCRAEFEEWKAR